jgi:hypothetical protein
VAVTVARHDTVSAGATEPAVEVVGSHQSKVTVDLTATQVRQVAIGMAASIAADGVTSTVGGTVSGIDGAPNSSGDYPVTIELARHSAAVTGADAAVTIVLATARHVLAVPTSAIHQAANRFTVHVRSNGRLTTRSVVVGVRGASLTQVRSGLHPGDQVVLADLNASVPSSSSTLTNRGGRGLGSGRFGTGGFGGVGGASGAFTGGAPGGTGTP